MLRAFARGPTFGPTIRRELSPDNLSTALLLGEREGAADGIENRLGVRRRRALAVRARRVLR